jgi:hypothetical protein
MRFARFTSSDATDGSSNRDCLLHDSMESSTLLMTLGVYCSNYGSLCNDTTMNTDFFRLPMGRVQDSGAAIADRVAAP